MGEVRGISFHYDMEVPFSRGAPVCKVCTSFWKVHLYQTDYFYQFMEGGLSLEVPICGKVPIYSRCALMGSAP